MLNSEQEVQECDATKMIREPKLVKKLFIID